MPRLVLRNLASSHLDPNLLLILGCSWRDLGVWQLGFFTVWFLMRSWVIDLMKFLAAQCIVIHHLLSYGPMRDVLEREYPRIVDALFTGSRLAVQLFLVIGGYLTAQSLMRARGAHLGDLLVKRYLRLTPFYLLSLVICAAVVGAFGDWVCQDWVPEGVTWTQLLAHALLLQGVLHVPSMSAGVWYVAIDFQLFAMVAFLASLCRKNGWTFIKVSANLIWVLALLTFSSLWFFNLTQTWDDWAIYFMGAYGLGLLAAFAARFDNARPLFFAVWLFGWVSLTQFWRVRILVALMGAILLYCYADHSGEFLSPAFKRRLSQLGNAAYATFLNHFAWVVIFSALWNAADLHGVVQALVMVLLCWFSALAWGLVLHRFVEPCLSQALTGLQAGLSRLGFGPKPMEPFH
jgi:peptidoglycan/LPS O-acetylase OafA/YrhL